MVGIWPVILGWFLFSAASSSQKYYLIKKLLSGRQVATLMNPHPITIPPEISVARLVEDYFLHYHFSSFPVTREDTPLGLVGYRQAKALSPDKRALTRVSEIMTAISTRNSAAPEEDLWAVFPRLKRSPEKKLLVIKDTRLVGILSRAELSRFLEIRSKLLKA